MDRDSARYELLQEFEALKGNVEDLKRLLVTLQDRLRRSLGTGGPGRPWGTLWEALGSFGRPWLGLSRRSLFLFARWYFVIVMIWRIALKRGSIFKRAQIELLAPVVFYICGIF